MFGLFRGNVDENAKKEQEQREKEEFIKTIPFYDECLQAVQKKIDDTVNEIIKSDLETPTVKEFGYRVSITAYITQLTVVVCESVSDNMYLEFNWRDRGYELREESRKQIVKYIGEDVALEKCCNVKRETHGVSFKIMATIKNSAYKPPIVL